MGSDQVFVLAIAIAFFTFMFTMIRMKHKHEMAKLDRIAQGNADRSLTTGELEDLVRVIVTEMVEPLEDRIDHLSRQLGTGPAVDESFPDRSEQDKTLGRTKA